MLTEPPTRTSFVSSAQILFICLCTATCANSSEPAHVQYLKPKKLATLANSMIAESSGLACSRLEQGVFWTHNDSGDEARIYAFDRRGRNRGIFLISNVSAQDWEDMASLVLDGQPCLLLADIGDNLARRKAYVLHLVKEPVLRGLTPDQTQPWPILQTIHFIYEDGSHNCEAVGFDEKNRTILLVTKERTAGSGVYSFIWPEASNSTEKPVVARRIATTHFPLVTAMDIHSDGQRAIVTTYGLAFEYLRSPAETWAQAFAREPGPVITPFRRQGESVCYCTEGTTLYFTSEKRPTPLFELSGETP